MIKHNKHMEMLWANKKVLYKQVYYADGKKFRNTWVKGKKFRNTLVKLYILETTPRPKKVKWTVQYPSYLEPKHD